MHVLNRSPTAAVKNETPEESWSGIKPNVEYFRVFGCLAYVHVPDKKRVKLDDKSTACVMLGISEESKAYRLFDPVAKIVLISRDVVFEENECWNWGRKEEELKLDILTWGDDKHEDVTEQEEKNEELTVEEQTEVNAESNEKVEAQVESEVDSPGSNQGRIRRRPFWMDDYVSGENLSADSSSEAEEVQNVAMFIENADPNSYEEAAMNDKWKAAMDLEIEAIERNKTWELVELPQGAKTIGVKWVYKTKLNENEEIDKCKARLVAKGYEQQYGVDYNEVFAPVARWDTIRMVLALAAQKAWTVYQLDVKSAFLHGDLSETVYVAQPQGYEKKGEENKAYRLKKALYGLKQAPRAWYSRIEAYFLKEGFKRCSYEYTLFIKSEEGG